MSIHDVELITEECPKIEVTDVPITALSLKEQVEQMVVWANERTSKIVCVANVHMLIESRNNPKLRKALDNAHLVTPDGMPLVWVMRSLGARSQERVAGMDLFKSTCQRCAEESIPIYLLGSTKSVLEKMVNRLKTDFPRLIVAGAESPPFRKLSQEEEKETIDKINSSGAGLTFVALGCPKQEDWMLQHYNQVNAVMVGVGAVFPVYAGDRKHAPKWIQENGLEWFYRLSQEPKRLFGRYASTIPPFIYFALKQIVYAKVINRKSNLTNINDDSKPLTLRMLTLPFRTPRRS